MSDLISRQAAIDGKIQIQLANGVEIYSDEAVPVEYLKRLPTVDAVPLPVARKAAKKLAYIHQQIDLYGDRPDLHDEEYWLEYLMDEEWKDPDIE
jgi:cell division septal protein FtsQ